MSGDVHVRLREHVGVRFPRVTRLNGCYTYAIQLVTGAIATGERCDGFDYRIYHRFHQQAELAYLEHTRRRWMSPIEGNGYSG